ncbi:pseudouridine synthase [Corynebacterium doosanense]|nr:pseudouridine synthase [Corynebacterium doosanense]
MIAPIPSEKNARNGARVSSKFMRPTIVQRRRGAPPLPVKDGLNPTRVRVPEGHTGITARDFLTAVIESQRHRHPQDDGSALAQRFADHEVVDPQGNPLDPDTALAEHQDVWFYRRPAPEKKVPFDIAILHEDDRLLVVNKPPFLATMPRGQHITETATVRLRRETGNNDLSPAHRLDRLTSGVLFFVKNPADRGAYQTLFANREVQKTYHAIAPHRPELASVCPTVWENRIEKTPGEFQARIVPGEVNAVTTLADVVPLSDDEHRLLESHHGSQPPLARYVLSPQTGKTHQLRLHMHLAGAPILGDNAYPAPLPAAQEDFHRPLRLSATQLSFRDPFTHDFRTFRL